MSGKVLSVGVPILVHEPEVGSGIITDIDDMKNAYTAFFPYARKINPSITCELCTQGTGCWKREGSGVHLSLTEKAAKKARTNCMEVMDLTGMNGDEDA